MHTKAQLYNLKTKEKHQVGALVSTIFEKAFDSVWLEGLLRKLHASGVNGNFPLLIKEILVSKSL